MVFALMFVFVSCLEDHKSPVEISSLDQSQESRLAAVDPGGALVTQLVAGAAQNDLAKGTVVGLVFVMPNPEMTAISVEYKLNPGMNVTETHVWAGTVLSDIPKNAAPGKFPYQARESIPFQCGTLYLAIHATVCNNNGECETAWAYGGKDNTFIGNGIANKWGWFVEYTRSCKIILYSAGGRYTSNLAGRTGADDICQSSTNKPDGYANIHAFLSVNSTDEIRDMPDKYGMPTGIPITSLNGTMIADDLKDLLDGSIDVTLRAAGVVDVSWYYWWSGSKPDGSVAVDYRNFELTCHSWTVGDYYSPLGGVGATFINVSYWMYAGAMGCDSGYNTNYVLCVAW